jgi:protein kinase X
MNKGHGKAVDWYCLGIFIYELMVGRCPFMNDDPYEIFKMILTEKIRFPHSFDLGAKSIIRHLTDHDLSKRYGNLRHGSEDVKNHRFFKEVQWIALVMQKIQPTYIPAQKVLSKKVLLQGMKVKDIPESNDLARSPAVAPANDPFVDWF